MAGAGSGPWYKCCKCHNHVALHDDIVCKNFQTLNDGKKGRAYFIYHVRNVVEGEEEDRHMMTGRYRVVDVSCCEYGQVLGWKYIKAYRESQKFKEGRFVLAKLKIVQMDLDHDPYIYNKLVYDLSWEA